MRILRAVWHERELRHRALNGSHAAGGYSYHATATPRRLQQESGRAPNPQPGKDERI